MHAGWTTANDAAITYYIDRKANESRLAPLWAALITQDMGDDAVPMSAFNKMELYTQKYTFNGREFNPMLTWDGAYFQAMLPAIWLNERALMPDYRMVEDMTFIQMAYAAEYNIPMVSSSATTDDGYAAFGVPYLSESKVKFNNVIHEGKTGTPHAVALSYLVSPDAAVSALKGLKAVYPAIESEFGWYDAVDDKGRMSTKILSLDQGMFVGAFLAKDINADVQRYLDARGYTDDVATMYQSYVPNNG
ncbi:putative membrane protein precursor [Photobacterium aphoticum]|uniref:Putative membrane protein n=1 Tax=Photobacterium aphoticum TaxID=754436 RepID=A0A090QMM6_9GAMM|nr:putative membrane protein precursor [Photobacterium aphoticum]